MSNNNEETISLVDGTAQQAEYESEESVPPLLHCRSPIISDEAKALDAGRRAAIAETEEAIRVAAASDNFSEVIMLTKKYESLCSASNRTVGQLHEANLLEALVARAEEMDASDAGQELSFTT